MFDRPTAGRMCVGRRRTDDSSVLLLRPRLFSSQMRTKIMVAAATGASQPASGRVGRSVGGWGRGNVSCLLGRSTDDEVED